MAHTKSGGSTSLGRDSQAKRLGVKLFGGEIAKIGSILIRQRGTKFFPGLNVKKGVDDTLYATKVGYVKFGRKKMRKFDNSLKWATVVSVISKKP